MTDSHQEGMPLSGIRGVCYDLSSFLAAPVHAWERTSSGTPGFSELITGLFKGENDNVNQTWMMWPVNEFSPSDGHTIRTFYLYRYLEHKDGEILLLNSDLSSCFTRVGLDDATCSKENTQDRDEQTWVIEETGQGLDTYRCVDEAYRRRGLNDFLAPSDSRISALVVSELI